MKRLRISGLVRVMNRVREGLSTGIQPGEEEDFRTLVQGTVQQVEQICREHKISPEKLPSPSYRAYRYLKELDLQVLPVAKEAPKHDHGSLRIRNLISTCQVIQEQLAGLAAIYSQITKNKPPGLSGVPGLQKQIQALVKSVESALDSAGKDQSSLSNPSQRAYRWAKYLSQDTHLQDHIHTLYNLYAELELLQKKSKTRKIRLSGSIQFELYNLSSIYTVKQGKDGTRILAHEGFAGAPDEVIKALVMTTMLGKDARDKKGKTYIATVKAYANSAVFREIASQLDVGRKPDSQRGRGQHFDLEVIFNKVNQAYFAGQMSKPNLVWNKTLTHRKFGHYHPASDTVMISISLDRVSIPAYVVEFVMYHELLHKQLGIKDHKGRQYAHTRAFRDAEARFPKHKQAEATLNELGRKLLKGKS
jgi:hypothetical protein